MNANVPGKTVKVSGTLDVEFDGDRMILTPRDGLVCVTTLDADWMTVHFHHPLSGWYVQVKTPVGKQDDDDDNQPTDNRS